jgi:hypothetical protein
MSEVPLLPDVSGATLSAEAGLGAVKGDPL